MHSLRLLFLNTLRLWGGGELWTLNTLRDLSARGHQVSLLAAEDGALIERAAGAGIETISWPGTWSARAARLRAVRRSLRGRSFRALVGVTGTDARLAGRLRPSGSDTSVIFSRHLDKPLSLPALRRFTFRHLDLIIANSDSTRRTTGKSLSWFPGDRIRTIYNPFDADAFSRHAPGDRRKELGFTGDEFVVGAVGRLTAQKGIDVLIQAFSRVTAEHPKARLLIVGSGSLQDELREQVRSAGLESVSRFTGHVEDVQPYYRSCDLIAVPSRFEGFCYTAVEAQALGRPVVASRVSSLPEVMEDGSAGYLVPGEDPQALAQKILLLASDADQRRRMGEAGMGAVARFAPGAIYESWEEALSLPRR